jgi:hypothetical protein
MRQMTAPAVTSALRLCQHTSCDLPPDSRTYTTTRFKGKAATRGLCIRSRFLHLAQTQPKRFVQEIATLSSSYNLLSYSQQLPPATNRARPSNAPKPARLRLDPRSSSYKQLPPSLLQPHTPPTASATSSTMSGHEPYYVTLDGFRMGDQTTQQQRGSEPSQKSATQISDVPFPALHAPETMMALHSGLPINVALSDLCHNAYPVDGQDPRYSIEYFGECQDPYPLLDPELMATHPSGTALHLDNSSAAGKVDRQQHDLTALPQKQHQQYQQQQYGSGPDTNALGVYGQGMQHGSSYGQHPLPSPSDPFGVAASQRDGSGALPLQ